MDRCPQELWKIALRLATMAGLSGTDLTIAVCSRRGLTGDDRSLMFHGQNSPGYREVAGAGLTADPPASLEPARIAVYSDRHSAPQIIHVPVDGADDSGIHRLIDQLTTKAHGLARDQGGRLPVEIFRELVSNLVHASFAEVVITILDGGNTIRISDRGPGILDKQAAVRAGFTSADAHTKRYIRGVGSGLALVSERMRDLGGTLDIEDNIRGGTVVTVRVTPEPEAPLAPAAVPAYNLTERQLKTLLLTVELAPVGPTRIARELGVATSTAYRDLTFLEEVGLVVSQTTGHRSVTESGLEYLNTLL